MDQTQFTTTYSPMLVQRAAHLFWRRRYSRDAMISVIALIAVLYFFFVKEYREPLVILLLGVAIIYSGAVFAAYFIYRSRALATFRSMQPPEVTWTLTDESIASESSNGKVELKWNLIKKIWQYHDIWILYYANDTYSTLPVNALNDETKEFIINKVRGSGGLIA